MAIGISQCVSHVVSQLKADVARAVSAESILGICAVLGHTFRDRVFNPVVLVQTFLIQVLNGNVACSALRHLTGLAFSTSSYIEARARLPLALLERLADSLVENLDLRNNTEGLWRGHRTWTLDGSSFSMSDTAELQAAFGQPGGQVKGCGFPVAHILALFDAGTGFLKRIIPSPLRTHDMANAADTHDDLRPGDILLADRGFASFTHLALIVLRNLHAVFRTHQKQIVDFRPHRKHKASRNGPQGRPSSRWVRRLGSRDHLVEYVKPLECPVWIRPEDFAALPEAILVRELRYDIRIKGFRTRSITLTTTLLDVDRYPAKAIAKLYGQRWQIETNFRHIKITMKMDVLRCQTLEGVLKELAMYAIAYNLIRLTMLEASRRQAVPVDRISFIDALRWLANAQPGDRLPTLATVPKRLNRSDPRVKKRRPKQYDLMTKPRHALKKAMTQQ